MNPPQAQLVTYLTDVHSLEQNALATLKTAANTVDNMALRQAIQEHLRETEQHERLIPERDTITPVEFDQILAQEQAAAAKLESLIEQVAHDDLQRHLQSAA